MRLARRNTPSSSDAGVLLQRQNHATGNALTGRHDSATLRRSSIEKEKPAIMTTCGPDATDWLVETIEDAKSGVGTFLAKKALLFAQVQGLSVGIDARQVVEGGLKEVVLAMKKKNPTPTPESQQQLNQADRGRNLEKTVFDLISFSFAHPAIGNMLTALGFAGTWWYSQVKTNGPWDFKNNILKNPATKKCPQGCSSKPTVTLCGTCHETDVPANVFYGHVGAYLGFSENAILLGSNFANLQEKGGDDWDPPGDINEVKHGYHLRGAVTAKSLCAGLPATDEATQKDAKTPTPCSVCPEKFQ